MEIKLGNKPALVKVLKLSKADVGGWWGQMAWSEMAFGGNGELVESTVNEKLAQMNLENFFPFNNEKESGEAADFRLNGKLGDIRRISRTGTCFLAYGSQTKREMPGVTWRNKAGDLGDGGYMFVEVLESFRLKLWWVPAKWMLENFPNHKGDKISFRSISKMVEGLNKTQNTVVTVVKNS